MAVKDAIATILNRNAFYRDGYRMMIKISIVQGVVIAVLVFCIASLVMTVHTRQVYFATTSDGRIISLVPLNEPYRTQAEVVTWAATTAQSVMRFGYHDYRDRLQQASTNFTNSGWDSFSKALKEANIIDAITVRKLVVTLDIGAAPEVKSEGVKEGIYTWYLKFPVTITFNGAEPPAPINTSLLLRVVRVSTLQNPDGLSIEQWVTINPNESK